MAKYIVEWCEVKKTGETNGRPWKITNMTLKDEQGNTHDDVSTFDVVTPGITIEGVIEPKGQYKNFKSTPVAPKANGGGAYKQKQIEDTMEKKAAYIGQAQGNKELGIKVASTLRMAVDIAISQVPNMSQPYQMEELIKSWRKWLWMEWDKEDKDFPPFN